MAKTKFYRFVGGAETPTLPAAGTPSVSNDVVTLGYLDGSATIAGAKIYTGSAEFQSNIYYDITVNSSTTGSDQDLSFPSKILTKFTNASLDSIRSIVAPASGKEAVVILTNGKASGNLVFKNEAAGATAANRIVTGLTGDLTLSQGGTVHLYYDTDSSRWRIISSTPGGSGAGGGSALVWVNDEGTAPIVEYKHFNKCWNFEDGASQNLYSVVKVPQGYTAGNQIFLRVNHFHEAASASQLLSAQATLIEPGDAFDDVTDQYTSTNAAVSAGNKVITEAIIDLTSASGQINSNAVAPGDLIKIRLYRGTDSSTNDLFFIESASEVTFS
jgi:hypothetical protein